MQGTDYGKRQQLIEVFLEMNTKINLSAIRDAEGVYQKHILDSLEIAEMFDFQSGESLLDVGTGGGFPLLPLAQEFPMLSCYGLDATRKKCDAVQSMADEIGLKNVSLIRSRAEDHKGSYDIVTSRAVAHAEKLWLWTIKFAKPGGFIVWWKMRTEDEDAYITKNFKKWKVSLQAKHRYSLKQDDIQRVLYIMQKN